jgi:hypothetical protein
MIGKKINPIIDSKALPWMWNHDKPAFHRTCHVILLARKQHSDAQWNPLFRLASTMQRWYSMLMLNGTHYFVRTRQCSVEIACWCSMQPTILFGLDDAALIWYWIVKKTWHDIHKLIEPSEHWELLRRTDKEKHSNHSKRTFCLSNIIHRFKVLHLSGARSDERSIC